MIPVLLGSRWKFFPSLDQKDTGITDVSTSDLTQTAETGRVTRDKHQIKTDKLKLSQRCMCSMFFIAALIKYRYKYLAKYKKGGTC